MSTLRKHFFRDAQDNRTVVGTVLIPDGRYKATVFEGENDDIIAFGWGTTRMAAIADLNDSIAAARRED